MKNLKLILLLQAFVFGVLTVNADEACCADGEDPSYKCEDGTMVCDASECPPCTTDNPSASTAGMICCDGEEEEASFLCCTDAEKLALDEILADELADILTQYWADGAAIDDLYEDIFEAFEEEYDLIVADIDALLDECQGQCDIDHPDPGAIGTAARGLCKAACLPGYSTASSAALAAYGTGWTAIAAAQALALADLEWDRDTDEDAAQDARDNACDNWS